MTVSSSLPPTIAAQPKSQIVPAGGTATFTVEVAGSGPFEYQWRVNSTNLVGATNATLILSNVQQSQAGRYSVAVSSHFGFVLSAEAFLSLTPPAPPAFAWAKSAGGIGIDAARGAAADAGGNCYLTGIFSGSADFGTKSLSGVGGFDIFIAKCDGSGEWQWVQQAGGPEGDYGDGVAVDDIGNVFITGSFVGTAMFGSNTIKNIGTGDLFIAKYNSSGVAQWVRGAGSIGSYSTGQGVAADGTGNTYVCGTVGGIYVSKYDPTGARLWISQPAQGFSRYGYGVGVNSAGNGAICGYFTGTAFGVTAQPGGEAYVAGLNNSGSLIWFQHMWADSTGFGGASDVKVDPAGNAYVIGGFEHPIHFGNTYVTNAGSSDGYISKYDSNGTLQWVQTVAGTGGDTVTAVILDRSGDPYIAGNFTDSAKLESAILTTQTGRAYFVAKLNAQGVPQWVQQFGDVEIYNLSIDATTNLFVSGSFVRSASFGDFGLVSAGQGDVFLAKLGAGLSGSPSSLTVNIEGQGAVTKLPEKPFYNIGDQVTLLAIPARWFMFTGWSDGVTNNPRLVNIGARNNYTAVFSPTSALETLTFGGVTRTAPVGMPAIFVNGQFVVGACLIHGQRAYRAALRR